MSDQLNSHKSMRQGFTIVELLITVVVIAILAAITIVAYNGVVGQAKEASLKSDLRTAATELELINLNDGGYPSSFTPKQSAGNTLAYTGGGSQFCITATNSDFNRPYHTTQGGGVAEGECPSGPSANTMQTFTQSQCSALPIYTGANAVALTILVDTRGGTNRSYTVGRLADNKCWMLDNLKLGSSTGPINLTPSDSNVTSNFTLPQLINPGSAADQNNNNPRVFGPVSGDSGAGSTNYGYMYNFPAATAGATTTTLPAGSGTAQNSICPANWRLPSGGSASSDFAVLDIALGGDGQLNFESVPRWHFTGPFRGVFSGAWLDMFGVQGEYGFFWSKSAYAGDVSYAHTAAFDANSVAPGYATGGRGAGYAVRCLLD